MFKENIEPNYQLLLKENTSFNSKILFLVDSIIPKIKESNQENLKLGISFTRNFVDKELVILIEDIKRALIESSFLNDLESISEKIFNEIKNLIEKP